MLKFFCNILPDESCDLRFDLFAFGGDVDFRFAYVLKNKLVTVRCIEESVYTPSSSNYYIYPDEYGYAATLAWISDDILCLGFSTGILLFIDSYCNIVGQITCHRSAVKAIWTETTESGPHLWALHEYGFLILVRLTTFTVAVFALTFSCNHQDRCVLHSVRKA